MIRYLKYPASTKLTLVGMALLAIGAMLSYDDPIGTSTWILVVPMGLLVINLLAAIIVYPAINRRFGLLCFHIGLLLICLFAAIGRLTFFEAHMELGQGQQFDVALLENIKQGPLHRGYLEEVSFIQGNYTVDYMPGLARGPTRSYVRIADGRGGWLEQVVGDDTPLLIDGYRFYTSFNKGFAPILTWIADGGEAVTGTVHMPSYPLFEYRQDNSWQPPGSDEIRFWLRLSTGYDLQEPWILDGRTSSGVLVVTVGEQRVELQPGEEVSLKGGRLRYEALSTWMGYKVFYDPTLIWLFVASMLAVFGLSFHYWKKFADDPLAQQKAGGQRRVAAKSALEGV